MAPTLLIELSFFPHLCQVVTRIDKPEDAADFPESYAHLALMYPRKEASDSNP
jgi:hypothetical protein